MARLFTVRAAAVGAVALALGLAELAAAAGSLPRREPSPGYVDESACRGCHAAQAEQWKHSHHDLAMAVASPEFIAGNFEGAKSTRFGVETRFARKGDSFSVATEGPDGRRAEFPVRFAFGVAPLQQVLLELPGGRLQAFSLAWDSRPAARGGQRWFSLYPDARIAADDALHWSGHYLNWNAQCADCHSTDLRKNYDPATRSYDTRYSEIDVACQACHGRGADHVAWARGSAAAVPRGRRPALALDRAGSARAEIEQCARCHSRRRAIDAKPDHAHAFLDDYLPSLLSEGVYRADGQVEGEVYEYGSFAQSRMYAAGVRCSDCHEPHSLALRAEDNALCTRCHSPEGDPRFPTLRRADFDSASHHHHRGVDSAGARCVNCHMRESTFMQIDGRRDHSLRVPRPDLDAKTGADSACADCHAKRGAAWAAAAIERWLAGKPKPERYARPHYGEALAAGRARAADSEALLAKLLGDTSAPAIARATAAQLLGDVGSSSHASIAAALRDSEPLVRAAAAEAVGVQRSPAAITALAPLLDDPVGAVRSEALRALAGVPEAQLPAANRAGFRRERQRYVALLRELSDTPGGNQASAALALAERDPARAEAAYREALRIDARFTPALHGLAGLSAESGRLDEAERVLRGGLALLPEQGDLHAALGLLLAQRGDLRGAESTLARAEKLSPRDPRIAYNRGLALQQLGRADEARAALERALAAEPRNPDFLYALVAFHAQRGEWARALPHAEALDAAQRGSPSAEAQRARALLAEIRSRLAQPAPDDR